MEKQANELHAWATGDTIAGSGNVAQEVEQPPLTAHHHLAMQPVRPRSPIVLTKSDVGDTGP